MVVHSFYVLPIKEHKEVAITGVVRNKYAKPGKDGKPRYMYRLTAVYRHTKDGEKKSYNLSKIVKEADAKKMWKSMKKTGAIPTVTAKSGARPSTRCKEVAKRAEERCVAKRTARRVAAKPAATRKAPAAKRKAPAKKMSAAQRKVIDIEDATLEDVLDTIAAKKSKAPAKKRAAPKRTAAAKKPAAKKRAPTKKRAPAAKRKGKITME